MSIADSHHSIFLVLEESSKQEQVNHIKCAISCQWLPVKRQTLCRTVPCTDPDNKQHIEHCRPHDCTKAHVGLGYEGSNKTSSEFGSRPTCSLKSRCCYILGYFKPFGDYIDWTHEVFITHDGQCLKHLKYTHDLKNAPAIHYLFLIKRWFREQSFIGLTLLKVTNTVFFCRCVIAEWRLFPI